MANERSSATAPSAPVAEDAVAHRFHCSDQEYIERFHLHAHVSDALALLSQCSPKLRPLDLLATYFSAISSDAAASVAHRSFAHINAHADSRRAFIALFRRSFLQQEGAGSLASGAELSTESVHQLCCILCADFPFSLVRNAARITDEGGDEGPDSGAAASSGSSSGDATRLGRSSSHSSPLSLPAFAHKLFVLFFFSSFLNRCALAFRALDTTGSGRVSRARFLRKLQAVVAQAQGDCDCPPAAAIEEALRLPGATQAAGAASLSSADGNSTEDEGIMFNSFCVALFAHPLVAKAIQ